MGQVLPAGVRVGRTEEAKGRGKGNAWLAGTLGNVAAAAARTDSFLGER